MDELVYYAMGCRFADTFCVRVSQDYCGYHV